MGKNKLTVGISLMLLSALLTAVGQALWKLSHHGLMSWQLYAGFFCYGLGAVLMTLAFRFGSLSVLHPLLSTGYIFSIILGIGLLHETMALHQIVGDLVIVLGAVFLGISERPSQMRGQIYK